MYRRKIVLDFDGTIIRLFENYDLSKVTEKIYSFLNPYGVKFSLACDAFDSFSCVMNAGLSPSITKKLLKQVDCIITEAEIEALQSGIPVDGFRDFLKFSEKEKISIGIASNNSEACINTFLTMYYPSAHIPVVGREALHPEWLKPHTHSLEKICSLLSCEKENVVFVGDTIRDYQCAQNYGLSFIALTPTVRKYERILSKGLNPYAVKIVRNFEELTKFLFEGNER